MKILLIEDDSETAEHIAHALSEAGHGPLVESHGAEGLRRARAQLWDLIIVDRMLPGLDGLAIVSALRASGCTAAILFLTTLAGVEDRVDGLNAGADDYLVKPFAVPELLARVAALGRRSNRNDAEVSLELADLHIDLLTRVVTRAGQPIELLPREYRLLVYLLKHAGQVVTRSMLLEHVWDVHFDPHTSVVETHLSRLRSKIDRIGSPLIHTVRGSGYSLRAPQ